MDHRYIKNKLKEAEPKKEEIENKMRELANKILDSNPDHDENLEDKGSIQQLKSILKLADDTQVERLHPILRGFYLGMVDREEHLKPPFDYYKMPFETLEILSDQIEILSKQRSIATTDEDSEAPENKSDASEAEDPGPPSVPPTPPRTNSRS